MRLPKKVLPKKQGRPLRAPKLLALPLPPKRKNIKCTLILKRAGTHDVPPSIQGKSLVHTIREGEDASSSEDSDFEFKGFVYEPLPGLDNLSIYQDNNFRKLPPP